MSRSSALSVPHLTTAAGSLVPEVVHCGHRPPHWVAMNSADVSTWPFWAPSDLASVEEALSLSGLVAGEVLIDLGCGDGQVLVAAAERGARVVGVESDPELVDLARAALETREVDGEVIAGDLFDVDLDADVVFTYLAPATLQRLVHVLSPRRGTRLVTVDFDVPGFDADERAGAARLYRMPGRRRSPRGPAGWTCAGALVVAPPEHQSLTVLDLDHPGGPVTATLVGGVAGGGALLAGADQAARFERVAVDVRWEDHAQGTVLDGGIEVAGLDTFALFVVFDEAAESGCWELTDEGVRRLRTHLENGDAARDGVALVREGGG